MFLVVSRSDVNFRFDHPFFGCPIGRATKIAHLERNMSTLVIVTGWKVSVFGVFLVHIFPHSDWIRRIFSPNAGKYGPEKLRIRTLFTQCIVWTWNRHWASHGHLLKAKICNTCKLNKTNTKKKHCGAIYLPRPIIHQVV